MILIHPGVNRENAPPTDTLEELTCSVLSIFKFVHDHLDALVSKLGMGAELICDLTRLQIVIDDTISIILVDEKHRRLVVMEHHVGWFEHVSTCIPDHRQVHQILESALIAIPFVIFSILVDFDDRSVHDECSIVGKRLQALTVVTVAELGIQIFVDSRFLVLEGFLARVKIIDVFLHLEISFTVSHTVIFKIAIVAGGAIIEDLSPIAHDLGLKPGVVHSCVRLTLARVSASCTLRPRSSPAEQPSMIHLEKALSDDALHWLDVTFIDQVEDPGWDRAIGLLLTNPHQ